MAGAFVTLQFKPIARFAEFAGKSIPGSSQRKN